MAKDSDKQPLPDEAVSPEGDVITPRIPTERFDLKILQALRKIIRGVDIHSRKLVGTHDITAPQLICLITVAQDGPLTLKAIAEKVFLSPSTVVGILDRLEGKGLVLRARDTRDRRLVNVTATATGRALVQHAPSPLQEGLAGALKELPEIEQATIALSLQRIVDLMEVEALDAAPMLDTGPSLATGTPSDPATESDDDKQGTSTEYKGVD
ncbi:MAG: MarR family winged helix-turn-helix transcriptional regulator [Candidatus Krumholzibacteriia bacterium]